MFCEQCGKEIPDGFKFCDGCGKPTGETVQGGFVPDYEYSQPPVQEKNNKMPRLIAAVCAVFTVATLLLGWLSLSLPLDKLDIPIDIDDVSITSTTWNVATVIAKAREVVNEAKNDAYELGKPDKETQQQIRAVTAVFTAATIAMYITVALKIVAVVLLALFAAFMAGGKKAGALGISGFVCALLSAIVFMVILLLVNMGLDSMTEEIGIGDISKMLEIGGSAWMYISFILSIAGCIFTAVKKRVIDIV